MALSIQDLLKALSELPEDQRKALAGELAPVATIAPVAPEVRSHASQDGGGKVTSIRLAVKHGKRARDVYAGPGFFYGILAHADDVALAMSDAVGQFEAGKLPEGNASWESAFTELAEVLSPVLAKWREKFAPAAKATK